MAGYSGTPLAPRKRNQRKQKVVTIDAPKDYEQLLSPLPERVSFTKKIETARPSSTLSFLSEKSWRRNEGASEI